MAQHLVVIGAGQAAVQAIQTARQLGFDGTITLVGEEVHLPYQRPPLSKTYLAGSMPRDRLLLKPDGFYQSRGVDLAIGHRAEELDVDKQRIRLDDDRILTYDQLIIASGGRPRHIDVSGADLPGVHYLRAIPDVDAIIDSLDSAKELLIVGAGYIGLEVAAVAVERGLRVTVLEAAERILARVVCAEVAQFYHAYHEQAGVRILCNAAVSGFKGSDRVVAVETSSGDTFPCDLAIIGIGIVPNVELAQSAGLDCDNGILVDSCARTADPMIVAAGDCTNHPHALIDANIRLESVQNAVEQGKSAAMSLFGQAKEFDAVPWFWSDQYDLKLQIAGLALEYDQIVIRGDPDDKNFAAYYLSGPRLIAVDAINSPRDFINAKKLLGARTAVSAAQLADLNVDLSKLL